MFFVSIGTLINQFGSGMSVNCIMEFILHFGKELNGRRSIGIVVHTGSVNVGDLLVKTAFTQAYLPDFSQQMFKVVLIEKCSVLHPLTVDHIATDCEVPQNRSRPLPEFRSPLAVDPVSDSDDHIQIVVFKITVNLAVALLANC